MSSGRAPSTSPSPLLRGRSSSRGGVVALLLLSALAAAVLILAPAGAVAVPHHRMNKYRARAREASAAAAATLTPNSLASAPEVLDALRALSDLKVQVRDKRGHHVYAGTSSPSDDYAAAAAAAAAIAAQSSTGHVSSTMFEDDAEAAQRADLDDDTVDSVFVAAPQNISLFFPSECATTARTCCPLFQGKVCGGSAFGYCGLIQTSDCTVGSWITEIFDYGCICDGNHGGIACEGCNAGWSGVNCTEPTEVSMRRNFGDLDVADRQDVLDAFTLAKVTPHPFHSGISAYDWLVAYHQWAQAGLAPWADIEGPKSKWAFWQGPGAPTWHRQFQLLVDHTFRLVTGNEQFTMPYWNWAISTGTNMDTTLAAFGGDGDPTTGYVNEATGVRTRCRAVIDHSLVTPNGCNCTVTAGPFRDWQVLGAWGEPVANGTRPLTRSFACMEPSLPTMDVVSYVTGLERYAVFETNGFVSLNDTVEDSFLLLMAGIGHAPNSGESTWPPSLAGNDMSARVHRWLGGTIMSDSAASDPLFFLHLSFADGLFESWIRQRQLTDTFSVSKNGLLVDGATRGQNLEDCVAPHYPLHAHSDYFTSSLNLGYDYDFLHHQLEQGSWWLK